MFASRVRRIAQTVRHAPSLRSWTTLWNVVRPAYQRTLGALASRNGVEVSIAGLPIRLSPRFASAAWESIERESYDAFAKAVGPGDIVYDVGAHIGTYTILSLLKSAPDGRVVAYEPVGATLEFLKRHAQWNGVSGRVIFRPVCCGSESGQSLLYFREGEMGGDSGLLPVDGASRTDVRVRKLDSEVAELGIIPTIIKIDVEGWEWEVLKGAEATLARHHPTIFLSLHPQALARLGTTAEAVQGWLEQLAYRHRVIAIDHEIHLLVTSERTTSACNS